LPRLSVSRQRSAAGHYFDKELRLDKRLEAKDAVIGIWLCSLISTWAWCNNDALTHRTTDAGWPRSSDAPALTHAVQHQLSTGFNYNDRVPHVYKYIYIYIYRFAFTLKPPREPWCWARRGLAWPFGDEEGVRSAIADADVGMPTCGLQSDTSSQRVSITTTACHNVYKYKYRFAFTSKPPSKLVSESS
jgi:hypothetical protein